MSFEKKLEELENIVGQLEKKDVSLEDGIILFQQGLQSTKQCLEILKDGKAKIASMKEEMDKLIEEPIND